MKNGGKGGHETCYWNKEFEEKNWNKGFEENVILAIMWSRNLVIAFDFECSYEKIILQKVPYLL